MLELTGTIDWTGCFQGSSTAKVFDALDVAVVAIASDGSIQFVNRYLCEVTGGKPDVFVSKHWMEVCLDSNREDFQGWGDLVKHSPSGLWSNDISIKPTPHSGPVRLRWNFRHHEGANKQVSFVGFGIPLQSIPAGNTINAVVQRNNLIDMLEKLGGRVWSADPAGTTLWPISLADEFRTLGIKQFSIEQLQSLVPSDAEGAQYLEKWTKAFETQEPLVLEHGFNSPAIPGEVEFKSVAIPLYDAAGKCVEYIGASVDIGGVKQGKRTLADISRELRSVLEMVDDVYYRSTIDGHVITVSPSVSHVLGYTVDEFSKMNTHVLYVNPEDREQLITKLKSGNQVVEAGQHGIIRGQVRNMESVLYTKSGTTIPVSISALLMEDTETGENSIAGVFRDISKDKEARKHLELMNSELRIVVNELSEKQEQLDKLIQTISHDLRAPLKNVATILEAVMPLRGETGNTLSDIFSTISLMDQRLNRLFTMVFSEQQKTTDFQTDIEPIFDLCYASLVLQSHIGKVVLHKAFIEEKAPCSEELLQTVFSNLLSNSVKYRVPDRELEISVGSHHIGHTLEISYTDNGQGFSMKDFGRRLFLPFESAHGGPESRGIGLFLVKTQLERIGGTIYAESEPGLGTHFTVTIPVH